jgi:hypothetical protein
MATGRGLILHVTSSNSEYMRFTFGTIRRDFIQDENAKLPMDKISDIIFNDSSGGKDERRNRN